MDGDTQCAGIKFGPTRDHRLGINAPEAKPYATKLEVTEEN